MGRISAWWDGLSGEAQDALTVVALFVFLGVGFGLGGLVAQAQRIPERVTAVEARVDTLANGLNKLEHQLDTAAADRRELFRRMDEATRTRCWLVNKVSPNAVPPPECLR